MAVTVCNASFKTKKISTFRVYNNEYLPDLHYTVALATETEKICCEILPELLVARYVPINFMLQVIKRLLPCTTYIFSLFIKSTSRFRWPRGLRHRPAIARLMGLWVRILPGAWMFVVNVVFCAGRGLCEWPISRSGESY
jgi:hypothetical protein